MNPKFYGKTKTFQDAIDLAHVVRETTHDQLIAEGRYSEWKSRISGYTALYYRGKLLTTINRQEDLDVLLAFAEAYHAD